MNIDAEYIERLNGEIVDPQDLRAIIQAIATQPDDLRSFESTAALITELFPERPSTYHVAMIFRLEALDRVLKNNPSLAGLATNDEGPFFIVPWMLNAASTCKLLPGQNHRVEFDAQYFKAGALTSAKPRAVPQW